MGNFRVICTVKMTKSEKKKYSCLSECLSSMIDYDTLFFVNSYIYIFFFYLKTTYFVKYSIKKNPS